MDINKNGYLSLAEIDKGILDVLQLPVLFKLKPVIHKAFHAAKNCVKSKSLVGKDFVEPAEYQWLLKYLRQYYEYFVAFDCIDSDGDMRISEEEVKWAAKVLKRWHVDPSQIELRHVDQEGNSYINFDEFCNWAINQNLNSTQQDEQFETNVYGSPKRL